MADQQVTDESSNNGTDATAAVSQLPPPPIAAAAAPTTTLASFTKGDYEVTVPLSRHQAKLRECAQLYAELQRTSDRLVAAERQIEGQTQRYQTACAEVARLREVLHVLTEELRHTQSRMHDLSRENRQLQQELRAGQVAEEEEEARVAMGSELRAMTSREGRRTKRGACEALEQKMASVVMPGLTALAPHTRHDDALQGTNTLDAGTLALVPRDDSPVEERVAINAAQQALLVEYTVASFQMDCVPHVQMLQSLYRNDRSIGLVRPAISFAQLAVLERQLCTPDASNGTETTINVTLQGWCATAVRQLSLRLAEPQGGTVALLCRLLPCFAALRELELFALHSSRSIAQLAEALCSPGITHTLTTLALPELSVSDEALVRLWRLLEQRTQLASSSSTTENAADDKGDNKKDDKAIERTDEEDEAAAMHAVPLGMPTLDLTRCTITDTLTLKTIFCPALQTLLLANCEAMTDATLHIVLTRCPQLHTLDVSGCPQLSNACVSFINKHPNLRVLRLERCPQLTRLELSHVQVLYSSLTSVTLLRAPALRRLPLPITNRCALLQLHAPALEEMVLHDLVIDRHTLHPALLWSSEEWRQLARRAREREQKQQHDQEPQEGRQETEGELQQVYDLTGTGAAAEEGRQEEGVDEEVVRKRAAVLGPHSAPPQLRVMLFSHCTFTDTDELGDFLRQQRHLTRLSLHGCRGVNDAHMQLLPKTLRDLDLGLVASLGDAALRALLTRTPRLERLTLKQAGTNGAVSDAGLHALRGLTALRELNLLQLPALSAAAVSAVAAALPCLTQLYHESAALLPRRAMSNAGERAERGEEEEKNVERVATPPSRRLRVLRTDEEDVWLREMQCFPRDLLWLQSCATLSYWREGTSLPPPAALLVARTQESLHAGRHKSGLVATAAAAMQASHEEEEDEEREAAELRTYYAMQARCSGTPLRYAQGSKAATADHLLLNDVHEGGNGSCDGGLPAATVGTHDGNENVEHRGKEEEEADTQSAASHPRSGRASSSSPSSSASSLPSPTQAALARAEQHIDSAHSRDGVARLITEEPGTAAEELGPWGAADEMREQLRQPSAHDKPQGNEAGGGSGDGEAEPMAELLNNAALQ